MRENPLNIGVLCIEVNERSQHPRSFEGDGYSFKERILAELDSSGKRLTTSFSNDFLA